MKILILDNYDSFVYNLVHIIKEYNIHTELKVARNNEISLKEIGEYDKILLSPGPGIPSEAGIMQDLIKVYGKSKSILGICLGHQGIGEAHGASLSNLKNVFHGVSVKTQVIKEDTLFKDIPNIFNCGRYHSWVINPESNFSDLEVIAVDEYGNVMGIRHKEYDIKGLQFHPESILTEFGKRIMLNWLANN